MADSYAQVRAEARGWLEQHWDPQRPAGEWYELLARSGWGYPAWPEQWYGRGLPRDQARVVREERRRIGALAPPSGIAPTLMAPMLFEHGTTEQLERFLPGMCWGGETMCQFLSEPDAGSDLAGVTTRAERDGDEWVIHGSKVWTSAAESVDWGMLLARTNADVPKHRGLTFFLLRRDQPGVEIRPLRTMNGDATFNQVFLDGARVPHANVVGEANEGWAVTLTFLALEKNSYNPDAHEGGVFGKHDLRLSCAQVLEHERTKKSAASQGRGVGAILDELLARSGLAGDPLVRQELAGARTDRLVMGYNNARARANRAAGRQPGREGSISKVMVSNLTRRQRELGLRLEGAHGMLVGADSPSEQFAHFALSSPSISIAGGTDEIQKNNLGERVLGLPQEPRADKSTPFKDLPQNPGRR